MNLLFTDRLSRRAAMFAVTTAEFTAEGTANILVNRFIPLWGCPSTLLSDNGPQFCARLATAVYKLLGIHKLTTSAYHPSGNGGMERVNHTMAQMLAMVCNEHQNDWNVHLLHVEYTYNNSVSSATGFAPMKFTSDVSRAFPSPSSNDRTIVAIRASIAINSPSATSLATDNDALMKSCANSTPSPLLGSMGATPLSQMIFSVAPNTRLADGYGSTIPPPLSAKDCGKLLTIKSSKRNSR